MGYVKQDYSAQPQLTDEEKFLRAQKTMKCVADKTQVSLFHYIVSQCNFFKDKTKTNAKAGGGFAALGGDESETD